MESGGPLGWKYVRAEFVPMHARRVRNWIGGNRLDGDRHFGRHFLVPVEPVPNVRLLDPGVLGVISEAPRQLGLRAGELDRFFQRPHRGVVLHESEEYNNCFLGVNRCC